MDNASFSLYVHVPFCKTRCDYCDFFSSVGAGRETITQWYDSIRIQLERSMEDLHISSFTSFFIGGGTPSMLPLDILKELLHFLQTFFSANASYEWTIEANPEDITLEFLELLSQSKVSRISLGVQSLDDAVRTAVNRRASSATVLEKLALLSAHWKNAWSLDYIYGLPLQTSSSIGDDLKKLKPFLPDHVSLYELGIEDETVLYKNIRSGKLKLPASDDSVDTWEAAAEFLTSEGFSRYEVSNWERSGHACLHNERYWQMENWLGIGPSSVSNYLLPNKSYQRVHTVANLERYCKDPFWGQESTVISGKDAIFETLMMALRTRKGISFPAFSDRFSFDIKPMMNSIAADFPGFFTVDSLGCKPTDTGMDLLNLPLLKILDRLDHSIPVGESLC